MFESDIQMTWEMNEVIEYVKFNMKSTQDITKHYADKKMKFSRIWGGW